MYLTIQNSRTPPFSMIARGDRFDLWYKQLASRCSTAKVRFNTQFATTVHVSKLEVGELCTRLIDVMSSGDLPAYENSSDDRY